MSRLRCPGLEVEIEAIVFGLFHTLVDPQENAYAGFRRIDAVAAAMHLPPADVDLWWQQRVDEFLVTPVSPVDALMDLARSRRIVLSPATVADIDRFMGAAEDATLANPPTGVLDALEALAGLRLGILSNSHARAVRRLGESPLVDVVDDVCVSCFTGVVMPDPLAYSLALERMEGQAGSTVFVGAGDDGEFGGAREAGFAAVVAVSGPVRRGGWRTPDEQARLESQADVIIDDVVDLVDLIEI